MKVKLHAGFGTMCLKYIISFFFFGCASGIWKFLIKRSNPPSCNQGRSSINTGSLTH